jgi:hypothetical protein
MHVVPPQAGLSFDWDEEHLPIYSEQTQSNLDSKVKFEHVHSPRFSRHSEPQRYPQTGLSFYQYVEHWPNYSEQTQSIFHSKVKFEHIRSPLQTGLSIDQLEELDI